MYVGLLVLPAGRTQLHCGSGMYSCAVVAAVNPLQLTSLSGDMHWKSTVADMELQGLCEAHPKYVLNGQRRLPEVERSLRISELPIPGVGDEGLATMPVCNDDVGASYQLGFVARPEMARLFPEHADVYQGNEYQLFYNTTHDQCYLRKPNQTWAAPLGKEFNFDWMQKLKQAALAEQCPISYNGSK